MKAAVVFFSLTGQSEKVAKGIEDGLHELGVEFKTAKVVPKVKLSWLTNLVAPLYGKKVDVELHPNIGHNFDLFFLVGPVWSFSPSIPMFSYVSSSNWEGKKVAVFTVCRYRGGERASRIIAKVVEESGGKVVGRLVLKHPLPGILRTIKTYISGKIPKGYGLGRLQIVEAKLKAKEIVRELESWGERYTKIAVIGGGPSGSVAAYKVIQYFGEKGREVEVTVFEPKNFFLRGPKGCNNCAGIVPGWEVEKLIGKRLSGDVERVEFPRTLIQSRIDGFEIVVDHERVFLPTREKYKPYSVFRGSGPLGSDLERASLDLWLLSLAISKGARHVKGKVRSVSFQEKGVLVAYQTDKGEFKEELFDFVIGAFGCNLELLRDFKVKPPEFLRTYQMEVELTRSPPSLLRVDFIDTGEPGLATFTPKGRYATLSVLGERENLEKYRELLAEEGVIKEEEGPVCFCSGTIPIGKVDRLWGEGFILIGDASGLIKTVTMEGILPGIKAGEAAARALAEGKPENFERYITPVIKDAKYGVFLHLLWKVFGNGGIIALVKSMEKDAKVTEAFYRLMEMEPYRDVIAALSPLSLLRIIFSYVRYTHLNYKLRAFRRFIKLDVSQMLFVAKYSVKSLYHVFFRG